MASKLKIKKRLPSYLKRSSKGGLFVGFIFVISFMSILFLALWAIVPLMIIKGRVDEKPKIKTSPEVKTKKKRWF